MTSENETKKQEESISDRNSMSKGIIIMKSMAPLVQSEMFLTEHEVRWGVGSWGSVVDEAEKELQERELPNGENPCVPY